MHIVVSLLSSARDRRYRRRHRQNRRIHVYENDELVQMPPWSAIGIGIMIEDYSFVTYMQSISHRRHCKSRVSKFFDARLKLGLRILMEKYVG